MTMSLRQTRPLTSSVVRSQLVGQKSQNGVRWRHGVASTAAAGWEQGRWTGVECHLLQFACLDPTQQQQCLPSTSCHSTFPLDSALGLLTNQLGLGYRCCECPSLPRAYGHSNLKVPAKVHFEEIPYRPFVWWLVWFWIYLRPTANITFVRCYMTA